MPGIFISYRREDCSGHAGRLYDTLSRHFAPLFMDIDTLEPGVDFVKAIEKAVRSCEVLLALIGRQWLTSTDAQGHRRLDNPDDFVRLEIAAALKRDIRVIPVLVQGATMPRAQDLPKALAKFVRRHAHEITDSRWKYDVGALIRVLEKVPGVGDREPYPPAAPPPSIRSSIGMEFVLIPAGEFLMGSPDRYDGYDEERPAHEVQISQSFYLGKYEVTQAQWEAVMRNNPSRFTGDPNRPVENVSWEEVQGFIRKLNTKERDAPYRLPTEAEWEYACRAGSTTVYNFGDNKSRLGRYAWYKANAGREPHPVGQLQPNAWGLYDMHGNVWEWVQDRYNSEEYSAKTVTVKDPQGPSSDSYRDRVSRGGSWGDDPWSCRSARRGHVTPDFHEGDLGFRLLRTAW
jgi:formylglycine-generating enzyme required for sulfatase activity